MRYDINKSSGCCQDSRFLAIPCLLIVVVAVGCASQKWVSVRETPKNRLTETLMVFSDKGPKPTERTEQLLRVYDLTDDFHNDPRGLLDKLQVIIEREPSIDKLHAFAELSYICGRKVEDSNPKMAMDLYGASVLYAYQYLFDSRFAGQSNPYDPQFRGACDLYNGSLEAALRLVCAKDGLKPGKIYTLETVGGTWDITIEIRGDRWNKEDFDHFEFVSDYELKGLANHYRSFGLGVPLIAVRRGYPNEPDVAKYYPIDLSFPVTVLMRPLGDLVSRGKADRTIRKQAVLEIYDPLTITDIAINRHRVPLESDLSTPLAYFLSNPQLEQLATAGLLNPESLLKMRLGRPSLMGLYMMQPYEPGKIPVLMIHGLWSSPITWMEMYNDLCNSPEIRDRYQFWFYLYPTGQPFWNSAAELREELAEVRKLLDPSGQEPALDQMVLIGHSMGGLVSQMQTIDSGDDYWKLVGNQPIESIKADEEVRQRMRDCFFFRPNPSIRRVVTIGTPHRGSRFSNSMTQWLTSKLITLPSAIAEGSERLFAENKKGLPKNSILTIRTSIDSLSPDSPVFDTMLASRRPPWVKYHNVIGVVPNDGLFGRLAAGTDGVVARESAHLDNAESEIIVPADHTTVHAHSKTVLEVRRVLMKHLA
ncbi:MAG: hypothetical protein U9N87_11690, partial [Planctomycetota bacterium]|nr:hypothetical protein [Planctomycetota bacterium]